MLKSAVSCPCDLFHFRPSSGAKRPRSSSSSTMGRSFDEDPLTLAIAPPPDETPEQRQAREITEAEAKKISDEIDEQIRKEKEGERKKKKPVKLLLLGQYSTFVFVIRALFTCSLLIVGQSESGKTATLKSMFYHDFMAS